MADENDVLKLGLDISDFKTGSAQIKDYLKSINAAIEATAKKYNELGTTSAEFVKKLGASKDESKELATAYINQAKALKDLNTQQASANKLSSRTTVDKTYKQRLTQLEQERKSKIKASKDEYAQQSILQAKAFAGTKQWYNRLQEVDKNYNKALRDQATKSAADRVALQRRVTSQHVTSVNKQIAQTKKLKETNDELILSMKGFARVLFVQTIRRAFNELITVTRRAIDIQTEFEKKITEIRSISQSMQGTVGEWSDSLYKLSNAWGLDILDVAESRYQILSNQIAIGVIETERFSNSALKFAKIAKTDAATSVNLLTGVLNSYGKTASEVEDVAAKMFKVIELGRVRAEDLANIIGVAAVPAKQVGVTFEELGASMALLTRQGVRASTAQTLLRNVFQKLTKPTTEMLDLYNQWGVATAEQAVQAFGLFGIMEKLEIATKGSATEIAKAFGRIRAATGGAAIIGNLDKFRDILKEIQTESAKTYTDAEAQLFETAGDRVSKAMNELKNYFSEVFGSNVLNLLDGWNSNVLSLTSTIKLLTNSVGALGITFAYTWSAKRLAPIIVASNVIKTATISTNMWTGAVVTSTTKVGLWAASLKALKTALRTVAIFAAAEAVVYLATKIIESNTAYDKAIDVIKKWKEESREASQSVVTDYNDAVDSFLQGARWLAQSYAEAQAKIGDEILILNKKVSESNKFIKDEQASISNGAKNLLSSYTQAYKTLESAANKYQETIDKLKTAQKDLATELQDIFINIQNKFSNAGQQFDQIVKRANTLEGLLAPGGIPSATGTVEEYRKLFDLRVEQLNKSADIEEALNKKVFDKKYELYDKKPEYVPAGTVDPKTLKIYNNELQRAYNLLQTALIDEQTKTETKYKAISDELGKIEKTYDRLLDKMNKLITAQKGVLTKSGIKDGAEQLLKDVEAGLGAGLVLPDEAIKKIEELTKAILFVEPTNKLIAQLEESRKAYQQNTTQLNEFTKALKSRLALTDETVAKSKTNITDIVDQLGKDLGAVQPTIPYVFAQGFNPLNDLNEAISAFVTESKKNLSTTADLELINSLTNINDILKDITTLYITEREDKDIPFNVKELVDTFNTFLLPQFEKAATYEDLLKRSEQYKEEVTKQLRLVDELNTKQIGLTQTMSDNVVNAVRYGENLEDAVRKANEGLSIMAKNISDMALTVGAVLNNRGVNEIKRHGGRVGFARGGYATDTIAARLAPGEFVMNQRATQKFYSQLSAMNASTGQLSNSASSNSYNNTYGNINVTVGGTNSSANDIVLAIKRGISRGTIAW